MFRYVLGVEADFDWCQTAIKDIFGDDDFRQQLQSDHGVTTGSASSINYIVMAYYGLYSYGSQHARQTRLTI